MQKIIIAGLVLIGLAVTYVLISDSSMDKSQSQTQTPTSTETQPDAGTQPETTQPQAVPGQYVDYKDGVVAQTTGTKVLFFHAPWCPQCRELDTSIKAGSIPAGVSIIKVDYDSNQALRKQYGVSIQTTLVRVDDSGNEVKKFVAYDDPTLAAVTTNLLQ